MEPNPHETKLLYKKNDTLGRENMNLSAILTNADMATLTSFSDGTSFEDSAPTQYSQMQHTKQSTRGDTTQPISRKGSSATIDNHMEKNLRKP